MDDIQERGASNYNTFENGKGVIDTNINLYCTLSLIISICSRNNRINFISFYTIFFITIYPDIKEILFFRIESKLIREEWWKVMDLLRLINFYLLLFLYTSWEEGKVTRSKRALMGNEDTRVVAVERKKSNRNKSEGPERAPTCMPNGRF